MERLGLAPDALLARNPALIYARMTGWGQDGPLSDRAGHDINYLATAGVLDAIGPADRPVPPLNLVGDYGGGALYLVCGILAALLHVRSGGQGQVIDAAMCDGAASLMALSCEFRNQGRLQARGGNVLDGAAPWYRTYRCADGRFIAVGALEAKFWRNFCFGIGLPELAERPEDRSLWPQIGACIEQRMQMRTREEWAAILEPVDACTSAVLDLEEAASHPHLQARGTFRRDGQFVQPAPAPRFSRSTCVAGSRQDTDLLTVLAHWKSNG